jgi:basic membrane lipoprotein Med (substrate-binding protein (PBP1-ABC) superfamily)
MTPTSEDLSQHEKREIYGTYETNQTIKARIDAYMEKMASIECNMGIDSSVEEKAKAKQEQLILLSKIKDLDPIKYDILKKVI